MSWWKWSRTAASNASADGSINWAEGMAPSAVNDSARAMMAAAAKYRDDISGAITTGGTSTAYTLTSYQVFDTLAHMDGAMIAFTPHTTNGGTTTLNVDGLGAKPLRTGPSLELPSNALLVGTPYVATYYNATTEWILQGGMDNPYTIPLGAGIDYWAATAPNSAFAFPYGQAISRTTYATLFAKFGTTYGSGDGSTTFNLPDKRGRVSAPGDTLGGGSNVGLIGLTAPGQTGGNSNHTIQFNNMPVNCPWTASYSGSGTTALGGGHSHSYSGNTGGISATHTHSVPGLSFSYQTAANPNTLVKAGSDQGNIFGSGATTASSTTSGGTTGTESADHTHAYSGTTSSVADHNHTFNYSGGVSFGNNTGGGQSISNLQPLIVCNYILRVL